MSGSATSSRTRRILLVAAAVGALVVAPLTAWAVAGDFADVPPSHPAYRSVNSVAGAGVMGGDAQNRFRPGANVKRAGLATVLHRGLSRLAVDDTVADVPAGTSDPALIAAVNIGIDGLEPGNQGVLLQHTMQVESAAPLAADCELTLFATSTPENFDAGQWTTHLYAGTRGREAYRQSSRTPSSPGRCTPTRSPPSTTAARRSRSCRARWWVRRRHSPATASRSRSEDRNTQLR